MVPMGTRRLFENYPGAYIPENGYFKRLLTKSVFRPKRLPLKDHYLRLSRADLRAIVSEVESASQEM